MERTLLAGSLWQPMSRACNETEELRARQDEVEDLGDEEEQERLGEVGDDGDTGKGHAGEVAERVAREGPCWVPGAHLQYDSVPCRPTGSSRGRLTSYDREDRRKLLRGVP
jgi:hypothetical protein